MNNIDNFSQLILLVSCFLKKDFSKRLEPGALAPEALNLLKKLHGLGDFLEQQEQKIEHYKSQWLQSLRLQCFGELSSGFSHELNNPLQLLKSFNQIINKKLKTKGPALYDELKEYFDVVESNISRIEKISERMRKFTRNPKQNPEKLSVSSALEKALVFFAQDFQSIEVVKDFDPKTPLIYAEAERIEEILIELLQNAKEAVEERVDKILYLRTRIQKGRVLLEIEDNGCGITKENHALIFHPFFTTKHTSVGIGLSICKEIVKEQNGKMSFRSTKDQGSCFSLSFPRCNFPTKT